MKTSDINISKRAEQRGHYVEKYKTSQMKKFKFKDTNNNKDGKDLTMFIGEPSFKVPDF